MARLRARMLTNVDHLAERKLVCMDLEGRAELTPVPAPFRSSRWCTFSSGAGSCRDIACTTRPIFFARLRAPVPSVRSREWALNSAVSASNAAQSFPFCSLLRRRGNTRFRTHVPKHHAKACSQAFVRRAEGRHRWRGNDVVERRAIRTPFRCPLTKRRPRQSLRVVGASTSRLMSSGAAVSAPCGYRPWFSNA